MTDTELSWLLIGVNLGCFLMLAVQLLNQAVDARRAQRAAVASLRRSRKWIVTDGWRATLHQRERV